MKEAWTDECAARFQPLADQYKPIHHQTFEIEKQPDHVLGTKKFLFLKKSLVDVLVYELSLSFR